jgi:hypothetical protein
MLTADSTVVRTGDLVTAPVGDAIAMLNIDAGSYYVLDEIAAAIWDQLQAPITPGAICERLRQRYDVAPAQCETDVLTFLRALQGKGLLRIVA